ncbi:hypothetical protein GCM10010832_12270 [Psychroflexus planctonicus]|uniref:Mannosyltransferase n=2 Tax=Psychroflexus planctonicus TaxID=1526575 RepID=A0ABQ1SEU7_9FLAO|nr:hypothetical protein GCM10010832_12270 [Psychroflexus planctonicus]
MQKSNFSFTQLTWISIGLRLIFLFSLPILSQDFYRFIWDGRMLAEGISPYLFTPKQIMEQNPDLIQQSQELVNGMQDLNASHYSNYPPVSQWIYFLAAKLAPNSIIGAAVVMRVVLILADIGIIFIGKKILQHFQLPVKNIFWFALNPLIILELTGNLHFEGIMLFLVLLTIYLLIQFKWIFSALFFGLSVATKLLPLVLLPVFYQFFKNKNKDAGLFSTKQFFQFSCYSLLSISVFILSFWGLAEEDFISHFTESIGLWFGTFEFNASFYYLFRWVGFQLVGWNTIETLSKILAVLIFIFVIWLAFFTTSKKGKNVFVSLVFAASFYLFFSTTVHPWYLATPLLLSVFTQFRFVVVWSFLVMLSYAAYQQKIYQENLWLVALEYLIVLSYLAYELFYKKSKIKLA